MTRGAFPAPLRTVTAASDREGRGSFLGPATNRTARWWELTLECGHMVERPARYTPDTARRTRARRHADMLPPPRWVRCEHCRAGTPAEVTP